jgi:NADPH:quinone reductase
MTTMKAIEISQFGAAHMLTLCERPVPTPAAGEVLIKVAASGINRPDVLQRKGLYPVPAGVSDIPGLEIAGTIESGDATLLAAHGSWWWLCAILHSPNSTMFACA